MFKKIVTNPFFVFPLLACLVFWPFTFQLFSLKNDALTYYYPIRTLISDGLNNSELPFWTPYINMGYPLHADMQAGAWNPVIWAFALLTKYSLAAFHYELLFYISFAGIGFYFLCRELGSSRTVAYTMAAAYQFSGFMLDSVQFFTCISSACYIPFVFIFFRKMTNRFRTRDALTLALFLFLLFTGGYPSLFIITSYILIAYLLFRFFGFPEKISFIKKISLPVLTAVVSFVLLSLPAIISFILHLPEIERGKSQALSVVLENSMNPASMLSLISPFGVTASDQWLDSSILMRNMYIGIIPLIFLIYACFDKTIRKNREIIFFFCCAFIMLGLAWGKFFFLRQLAYHTLPFMDSFRHPALFRLFAIFFFLLIAARSFSTWSKNPAIHHRIFKNIVFIILAVVALTGVVALMMTLASLPAVNTPGQSFKDILSRLDFTNRYLVQFPFILAAVLLTYVLLVKKKNIKFACILLIADMFFAAQLNMPITVYGAKSFSSIEQSIARNPEKFPLPRNQSIQENSMNSVDEEFVAGSRLPFSKKIGRNDYYITPGNLFSQDQFYESGIKNVIFRNPVLYFADSIISWKNHAFADQENIAFTDDPRIKLRPGGKDSMAKITITQFSANELNGAVSKKTAGILVFLQNKYHGWHAYIDDRETAIFSVNTCFMALQVPEGDHKIRFRYRPESIVNAWYISICCFFLLIIMYCLPFFSRRRSMKHRTGSE